MNGKANPPSGTEYNAEASVSCNAGYHPEGSGIVLCQDDGQWSTATTCVINGTVLTLNFVDDTTIHKNTKYIEDICLFEVNTKYISSSELKIYIRIFTSAQHVFNSRVNDVK